MSEFLTIVLFFLPAGISNMTPVILNKIPILNTWNTPLDLNLKFNNRRILGDNKRLRGLIFGTLLGGVSALLISMAYSPLVADNIFFYGCLLGFGALTGDAIESFFKRQNKIEPGTSWFPFDQLDYILGGIIFIYPFVPLTFLQIFYILTVFFGLHLLVAYIGFWLGLKDKPI